MHSEISAQAGDKRRHVRGPSLILKMLRPKPKANHAAGIKSWLSNLGPQEEGFDCRLVPQLVDRLAERRPEKVWAHIPKGKHVSLGFRTIRWRQLADAINRAADWLEGQIGGTGVQKGEAIAFLAPSKNLSVVLVLASAKISCPILFLSPRNSLEGQLALIDKLGCKFLMTPEAQLPQTQQIKQARPLLNHLLLPDLNSFLEGPMPKRRQFRGTFEEHRQRPLLWLHSSGTTSLPKPVPWTHSIAAGYLTEATSNYAEGESLAQATVANSMLFLNAFPMFHAAGISHILKTGLMTGVETVLPPEGVPMNATLANELFKSAVTPLIVFMPPTILEEIYKDASIYKNLLKQARVVTGGAGLSKEVGDAFHRDGLRVINILASSETGYLPLLAPKPISEWNAFYFPKKAPGVELHLVGEKGENTYELVLHRIRDRKRLPPVFDNFPKLDIYRTNDMLQPHPDPKLSHLWVVAGRADDVIVLSNGEKFNPVALEQELSGHKDIATALVLGRQREQSALLIQPKDERVCKSVKARKAFIDALWPEIAKANSKISRHGRVVRSHVMLTSTEKGVLRTPKGSVQRSKMYELYGPETEALYVRNGSISTSSDDDCNDSKSQRTAVSDDENDRNDFSLDELKKMICDVADASDAAGLGFDDNIFEAGFDSLSATQLVKRLRARDGRSVETSIIYNNPSVRSLYLALNGSAGDQKREHSSESENGSFRATSIAHTLQELSKDLPAGRPTSSKKVLLITGTNGGLGQHLLSQARDRYSHVYCLLRQPVPDDQQDLPGVTYIFANLALPYLGLMRAQWSMLLFTVTHIVHNAWLVDFNHPLPHFTSNLAGVRGLIEFAAAAHNKPRIWFASSIGAVAGMASGPDTSVAEKLYPLDPSGSDNVALGAMGYAQSKRAAELLLARAGEISGVRSTVVRIGQIAGTSVPEVNDQEGNRLPSWQARDSIPTLLRSARYLKAIPRTIEGMGSHLDWTPIDHVAAAALDLLEDGDREDTETTQIFHLTNPASDGNSGAPTWEDLLPVMKKELASHRAGVRAEDIETVSFAEWVDRLEASAQTGSSREEIERENPAVKLLEFFKGVANNKNIQVPRLDTVLAREASVTLRAEKPMNGEWMAQWMREWLAER